MKPVQHPCPAMARQIESAVLQALAERGQSAVAAEIGISETRISRFKNGEGQGIDLPIVANILAACGMTVVPQGAVYCDPQTLDATSRLLARALQAAGCKVFEGAA